MKGIREEGRKGNGGKFRCRIVRQRSKMTSLAKVKRQMDTNCTA